LGLLQVGRPRWSVAPHQHVVVVELRGDHGPLRASVGRAATEGGHPVDPRWVWVQVTDAGVDTDSKKAFPWASGQGAKEGKRRRGASAPLLLLEQEGPARRAV